MNDKMSSDNSFRNLKQAHLKVNVPMTSSVGEEKLKKYKADTYIINTTKIDDTTGEVVEVNQEKQIKSKRPKGTFGVTTSPKLLKLLANSNKRAENKMLYYIVENLNSQNEFTFSDSFMYSYKNAMDKFYKDKKYLIDNEYIATTERKGIYVLHPLFYNTSHPETERYILNTYFQEEYSETSKTALSRIAKLQSQLNTTDKEKAIEMLKNSL